MPKHEEARRWLDLGVQASNADQQPQAEQAFLRALALDPGLIDAQLGLGLTYMATRRFAQAVEPLRLAAAAPDAPGFWSACLAQSLYMSGDFAGSADAFEQAARDEPLGDNAQATLVRTRCLAAMISGSAEKALQRYQRESGCDDDGLTAFADEASAILAVFGHVDAAAAVGRWRQVRAPEDRIAAYRLDALQGAAVDRAPADYVAAHFDAFADRFDHQLVEMLGYSGPADLITLLLPHRSRFDRVLDLGCGTGLAMPVLAPLSGAVTGVDLSSGMLARAAARGGYEALVQAEALTFLTEHPATFDLVFAADVLIYFGDMAAIFAAVARALRPGGYFVFSTERREADWTLLSSGRFAHGDAYIDRLATPTFTLKARATTRLRQEGRDPVEGALHILARH
jgi:predicted TPR repeat methyltransferase